MYMYIAEVSGKRNDVVVWTDEIADWDHNSCINNMSSPIRYIYSLSANSLMPRRLIIAIVRKSLVITIIIIITISPLPIYPCPSSHCFRSKILTFGGKIVRYYAVIILIV